MYEIVDGFLRGWCGSGVFVVYDGCGARFLVGSCFSSSSSSCRFNQACQEGRAGRLWH